MTCFKSVSFVLLLAWPIYAFNNWTHPCFDGTCRYDLEKSSKSMAGTLLLNGSTSAISDITPAAGWYIIDCDPSVNSQVIRLVCVDESKGCDHLFKEGAENTVVRLPDSCGKGPFVRVTQAWIPEDQSIPQSVNSRVKRQDGSIPGVVALQLDATSMNYPHRKFVGGPTFYAKDAVNYSPFRRGSIRFVVRGSTTPDPDIITSMAPAGHSRTHARDLQKREVHDIIGLTTNPFSFQQNASANKTINVDDQFLLFNQSVPCGVNDMATFGANVDFDTQLQVELVLLVSGALVPFNITEFVVFAGVNGPINGTLNLSADLVGEIDTGPVPLFSDGLPGLSVPDILTIGPSFQLNAELKATLDLDLDLAVNLNYNITDLLLFFPPQVGIPSSAKVSPQSSPLKLSVSPNVTSAATLEAHLIPTIDIGLTLLNKDIAAIFLNLDTSAILDLNLTAGGTVSDVSNGGAGSAESIEGCTDVKGDVSINAGATASFFDIFDKESEVSLFEQTFDFFQKCTGSSAASSNVRTSRTDVFKRARHRSLGTRPSLANATVALGCANDNIGSAVSIVDQTVHAS